VRHLSSEIQPRLSALHDSRWSYHQIRQSSSHAWPQPGRHAVTGHRGPLRSPLPGQRTRGLPAGSRWRRYGLRPRRGPWAMAVAKATGMGSVPDGGRGRWLCRRRRGWAPSPTRLTWCGQVRVVRQRVGSVPDGGRRRRGDRGGGRAALLTIPHAAHTGICASPVVENCRAPCSSYVLCTVVETASAGHV